MAREQAKQTVFIDSERVRVSEWRFAPGSETGHHRHAFDYVVVPIVGGELTASDADGEHAFTLTAGQPYARDEGVEHNVINASEAEVVFVEVELK
jgi:quercetin dioxygenase-like cupin family protein